MTRTVTLAGYAVLAVAAVAVQAAARRGGRVATLAEAVRLVTRWPTGRWSVLAGWLWLGWHLFVRAHRG